MPGLECREYADALIVLARGGVGSGAVAAHLETCDACGRVLDGQLRLTAAAAALAKRATETTVPPRVEQALMKELQSVRSFPRRRFVYGVLGGAVAASLALAWWMAAPRAQNPVIAENVPAVAVVEPAQPERMPAEQPRPKRRRRAVRPEQPFISIPYTLPLDPYERADVMRMDLPVAALIAAGLPMSMVDPGASARADVLVGQDGRALAIRLISISN